jgi:hypothetical protein
VRRILREYELLFPLSGTSVSEPFEKFTVNLPEPAMGKPSQGLTCLFRLPNINATCVNRSLASSP